MIWVLIALVGASIGSFLTLATYRLPRDEKIGMTRSRCPACGATLKVRDLFPIVSWLLSGGTCRHCKVRVSARYPLTELACAAGTVLVVQHYGLTLAALGIVGLWWCIVAIVITDLEHTIILDEVQVAVVLFGVLYHYAIFTPLEAVFLSGFIGLGIGLALKYGFLYLRNKDGLGLGDVKFLFGAGIWLADGASFVPFLFYSGLLGIACGMLWRVLGRGEQFPFGPALAAALLLCVIWPDAAHRFWQLYGLRIA
jgi:prepilin signal peptidase PulO-like enzyme (type II secretory pathway)